MKLPISFSIATLACLMSFYTHANQSVSYTYNEVGQVLTEDGPRTDVSDITINTYNAQGLVATTTNALGHVTTYNSYDASGNLLSVTDPNGVVTEFTYHERGWLLSSRIKHPTTATWDAVTSYTYDVVGQMLSTTLPNGVNMFYEYDDARRLTAVKNGANERIEYTLDAAGNRTQQVIKNAGGAISYSVSSTFDELSRVMEVIGNNGQQDQHQYDVNDNLTTATDGRTNTTQQTYDALNRVKKIIDPNLGETQFTYNSQDQIETVTDARGNTTTYNYDGLGNLTLQISPDTGTTTFTYDAAGNRLSQTDARGVVTNYTYDALNRIKTIQYPSAPAENVTFTYDWSAYNNQGIGRLAKVAKTGVTVSYAYDHLGFMKEKKVTTNNTNKDVKYTYDSVGNVTRIAYPSGRYVYYYYDTLGRVNQITAKLGSAATQTLVSNIGYLPFGPANTYKYGNNLTHNQTFDQDYRLTGIQVGGLLNRTYGYDPVNNITSIVNSLNTTNSQSFSYDALNRLITANGGYGSLGYDYDAVGNRLSETRNGSNDTYQYETTSNRLTGITRANGNRNFTYDAAGNPVQRTADNNSTQTYSFNKANRLSSVSVNGTQAATYIYNPLGQRVLKTFANGAKENYHYNESGQLIAVLDGAGVTLREYIYWGEQQIALINGGTTYYIHNDHLNTPQVITNQSQQVVWMGDYEPFGKVAANTNNSVEIFSRFPGQYLDSETGLYYNYFRDYDPSIGRYIESDPIGLAGGINTYAYVGGNPIKYIDPTGEAFFLAPFLLGGTGVTTTGGAGAFGTMVLGLGTAWALNQNKPERTPAEEAQADFDHDYYKNICEQKPPPSGDKCQDILNEANRAQLCSDLMIQFDKKWSPGRHTSDALREQARAHRLRKEYEQCKKDECP